MTYILDFVNNMEPPKKDGVTVYKVNHKTHHRIEVGLIVKDKIVFNKTKKSISEVNINKVTTYRPNFVVYSLDESAKVYLSIKEVFVNSCSIGYFDSGKLVLWSQYE